MYIFISASLSRRKCLPFPYLMISKSCDGQYKNAARGHMRPMERTLQTPVLYGSTTVTNQLIIYILFWGSSTARFHGTNIISSLVFQPLSSVWPLHYDCPFYFQNPFLLTNTKRIHVYFQFSTWRDKQGKLSSEPGRLNRMHRMCYSGSWTWERIVG